MSEKIGVVGLGYVGLPLASILADHFEVIGFDVNENRILELKKGHDHTGEVSSQDLSKNNLLFTNDVQVLGTCTFIIVAVPTPINDQYQPDLTPVRKASETVGQILSEGMMVVYESTVYPGVTEEICLPILEEGSGLKLGDFDLGYSPERVNPGDKCHTIDKIVKVVSGHSPESLDRASKVYGTIITAGIHRAPNIKTAEAAKVIENVQRDLNIALMNELSKIFNLMGLHTPDVLAAAGTKWNFHAYHPGLVGGHCIGVDPYYLTQRAIDLGYHPEVILAGRKINDGMGVYVADLVAEGLKTTGVNLSGARVWVLGLTFKEDVPDFRNTKAVDVVHALQRLGADVYVWEPLVTEEEIKRHFGFNSLHESEANHLDAVVLINGHKAFKDLTLEVLKEKCNRPVLVDVKNVYDPVKASALGFQYKSL